MSAVESRRSFLRFVPGSLALLSLPYLSGCGPAVDATAAPGIRPAPALSSDVPDGMAELYLLNDMRPVFGVERPAEILADDRRTAIVALADREYARFFMSTGSHTLEVWDGWLSRGPSVTIDAESGATYDVVLETHWFPSLGGFESTIEEVPDAQARRLMKKMALRGRSRFQT